jgi:hypothetical protein
MNTFRNYIGAFIIVAVLASLCLTVYSGLTTTYDVVPDEPNKVNVMQRISNLNLVQGINTLSTGIQKLKNFNILNPLDLLGGLASAGVGVLQIIGGTVTLPLDIFGVLTDFYYIPPQIEILVGSMVVLIIAVLLLQAYIKPFHPL